MLRNFLRHRKDCQVVRRLLSEHPTENLKSLTWYGWPLRLAASRRGMARLIFWNLFQRQQDEIAGNYGQTNLYYAKPAGDDVHEPLPTVWHCQNLKSQPWFDSASDPTCQTLEAHAATIIAEYQAFRSQIGIHPDNQSLVEGGRWDGAFLFAASGRRNDKICNACPRTAEIVESLPLCRNFGFVMFSGLEPGTHVLPHTGSSNLRLRHHLGVEVPEPEATTLTVGGQSRHWEEGQSLAFDDAFRHEVHHTGTRPRAVLSVDVWHPELTPEDIAVLSHPVFQRFGKVPQA